MKGHFCWHFSIINYGQLMNKPTYYIQCNIDRIINYRQINRGGPKAVFKTFQHFFYVDKMISLEDLVTHESHEDVTTTNV